FFLLLALNAGDAKPLVSTAVFVYTAGFAAALSPFFFAAVAMRRSDLKSAFPSALVSTFAFVYIALPMAMLVQTRQQWAGAYWVLFVLLVVWAGDILAYFVGRLVGRNLMSPPIRPHPPPSRPPLAQKIQARFCLVTEACLTDLMPCSLPRRCCGTMRVGA